MLKKSVLLAAAALLTALPASAAISVGPTINGLGTFTDSNTGRNWVRLDSYFQTTYNFMAGDLVSKGFTLATAADLNALFATVDVAADFAGVAAIMGKAPNRDLIWGAYSPLAGNGTVDWAFAFSGGGWSFGNQGLGPDDLPNGGGQFADMNFWAYTGAVPEPASWAMLIAGFGLVGASMRRRAVIAA